MALSSDNNELKKIQWKIIPDNEINNWNDKLRISSAHLYQYPLWNDPLKSVGLNPTYLCCCDSSGTYLAFVCIISPSIPIFKFGVIRCGPVNLQSDGPLSAEILSSLAHYSRALGFMCLRVSTTDETIETSMSAAGKIDNDDALPILAHYDHELVAPLLETDDDQLKHMKSGLRNKVRKAEKAGYKLIRCNEPHDLEKLWVLVDAMDKRKGAQIYARPLSSYLMLTNMAYEHNSGDLYYVSLDDIPVQVILIIHDRDTAHYVMGSMDLEKIGKNPSPSGWAHWKVMRSSFNKGLSRYSFGNEGDEGLKRFKLQFLAEKTKYLPTFTVILQPIKYTLWKLLFPLANKIREMIS